MCGNVQVGHEMSLLSTLCVNSKLNRHDALREMGYAGNLRVALRTWLCTTRTSDFGGPRSALRDPGGALCAPDFWQCAPRSSAGREVVHIGVQVGHSDVTFVHMVSKFAENALREMGVCRNSKGCTSRHRVHHSECPLRSALRELEMGVCRTSTSQMRKFAEISRSAFQGSYPRLPHPPRGTPPYPVTGPRTSGARHPGHVHIHLRTR